MLNDAPQPHPMVPVPAAHSPIFFVLRHLFEPFLPSQLPLHATHCSHAPGSIASVAARLKVPPRVPWPEIGQLDHTPTAAGHHTWIGAHRLLLLENAERCGLWTTCKSKQPICLSKSRNTQGHKTCLDKSVMITIR